MAHALRGWASGVGQNAWNVGSGARRKVQSRPGVQGTRRRTRLRKVRLRRARSAAAASSGSAAGRLAHVARRAFSASGQSPPSCWPRRRHQEDRNRSRIRSAAGAERPRPRHVPVRRYTLPPGAGCLRTRDVLAATRLIRDASQPLDYQRVLDRVVAAAPTRRAHARGTPPSASTWKPGSSSQRQ